MPPNINRALFPPAPAEHPAGASAYPTPANATATAPQLMPRFVNIVANDIFANPAPNPVVPFTAMPATDPRLAFGPVPAPMRVVRGPLDHRYFVDNLLDKAVMNARPLVPNVIQFGDEHPNKRSISMIEQLFRSTLERNHILNIGTVQFEIPTGYEFSAEINMHRVAAEIAATPGGASVYFNNIHPDELEFAKIFYLMGMASRMGFRIECIDSPESINRTDSLEHRDYYMTGRIRNTVAQGAGVIAITGSAHVAPQQNNLLRGTELPGGPAYFPLVNAVSLATYSDLVHPAMRMETQRNAAWGLPASHAEFVRFDPRGPNEYLPLSS
jgi:hypothetical protein